MEEKLTDTERKEITFESIFGLCKCGHPRNAHSKFIKGMFIECQFKNCICQEFKWPEIVEETEPCTIEDEGNN